MPHSVVVRAPSRLHFGLFSLARVSGRQFGGVGAMIREPGMLLRIEPSPQWHVTGRLATRIDDAADRWRRFHGLASRPPCQLILERAPPEHIGLGVGTQLALSVAAGLSAFCGLPASAPQELAISVGRGLRSAVGTYGFALGGLIVEQGKLPEEPISPLDTRIDLPEKWRFVLLRPVAMSGLCGQRERDVIENTSVDSEVTQQLIDMVREQLVPSVATENFAAFARGLYQYCQLAGSFYAQQQGGRYNGPLLTALVERLRSWGLDGIGQSSWGPTLFVAQPDLESAQSLASRLPRDWNGDPLDIVIAQPENFGAQINVFAPVSHVVR